MVVQYSYDAWGKHKVSGSNITLGNLNPFRYRSYFYDTETGLYFLQTRYYDPEVGRFLNMDSVTYADPEATNGLNLYVYCGNNPVMNIDPEGHIFFMCLLIGLIAGTVIGATVNGVKAYKEGARGWDLAGAVVTGALVGGAIGLTAGAVAGAGAALIGAGISTIGAGMTGGFALAGGGIFGSGVLIAAGVGTVVVGSSVLVSGVVGGLWALNVLFSKHNPGMSNKPPVSWTNIDEGLSVYKNFGGDSNKASEYLLNQFRGKGNWHKGAGTEFNALKKWFDRIIRLLL